MKNLYLIKPYVSVGPIKFGMSKEEVEKLFETPPDRVATSFTGKLGLYWDNISIKINKSNKVDEVSFLSGGNNDIILNDINLFEDIKAKDKLDLTESPFVNQGFDIYFSLGIAITGFQDEDEDKTVSIFSRELISAWKN